MYTPKHFKWEDSKEILEFVNRYPFGILVSVKDNKPIATHLPFTIEEEKGRLQLSTHLSALNEQALIKENQDVLVIFQEPHAYVSPRLYNKKENVPTWNYLAVHMNGKVKKVDDLNSAINLLEKMIISFDADYFKQWQEIDQSFKERLAKGIQAFQIEVASVEASKKVSQNKSKDEQKNIKTYFENHEDQSVKGLSNYM